MWQEARVSYNGLSQAELELGASFNYEAHDLRNWFDGPCVVTEDGKARDCEYADSGPRTYRMAEITDGSLSLTLRGSYTLSTTISFQA